MPQEAWSDKRERQYEHIKESEKKQGALDEARQGDRGRHRQQAAGQVRRDEEGLIFVDLKRVGTLAT